MTKVHLTKFVSVYHSGNIFFLYFHRLKCPLWFQEPRAAKHARCTQETTRDSGASLYNQYLICQETVKEVIAGYCYVFVREL